MSARWRHDGDYYANAGVTGKYDTLLQAMDVKIYSGRWVLLRMGLRSFMFPSEKHKLEDLRLQFGGTGAPYGWVLVASTIQDAHQQRRWCW